MDMMDCSCLSAIDGHHQYEHLSSLWDSGVVGFNNFNRTAGVAIRLMAIGGIVRSLEISQ